MLCRCYAKNVSPKRSLNSERSETTPLVWRNNKARLAKRFAKLVRENSTTGSLPVNLNPTDLLLVQYVV
jgi:hypothetical protein